MEPHDFERLADVCLARVYEVRSKGLIAEHDVVVAQLRQVWNARGAADLHALDPIIDKLGDCMDPDNARVFVGDAIWSVDR